MTPVLTALLPEFDHEFAQARRLLELVPEDRFAWRPHPRSMPLGRLARHLGEIPAWVGNMLNEGGYDLEKGEASNLERATSGDPSLPASRQELLAVFDRNAATARTAIATTSEAALQEPWSLTRGGKVLMTMPRAAVVRTFLLNHLIHHRGQLTVYLRLLDVPVPGLYGPSADDLAGLTAPPSPPEPPAP